MSPEPQWQISNRAFGRSLMSSCSQEQLERKFPFRKNAGPAIEAWQEKPDQAALVKGLKTTISPHEARSKGPGFREPGQKPHRNMGIKIS